MAANWDREESDARAAAEFHAQQAAEAGAATNREPQAAQAAGTGGDEEMAEGSGGEEAQYAHVWSQGDSRLGAVVGSPAWQHMLSTY
jgi:nitrous oxide reductase